MNPNIQIPRVILLGSAGVGKTSIVMRKRDESVDPQTTIINETYDLNVNGQSMKIVDTAGQERFRSMTNYVMRGSSLAALIFDLTSLDSFKALEEFYNEFKNIENNAKVVLVGNKCDLKPYAVTEDEIKNFAENLGVQYFITSAMDGTCINELFDCISNLVKDSSQEIPGVQITSDDDDDPNKKKNSGCC